MLWNYYTNTYASTYIIIILIILKFYSKITRRNKLKYVIKIEIIEYVDRFEYTINKECT